MRTFDVIYVSLQCLKQQLPQKQILKGLMQPAEIQNSSIFSSFIISLFDYASQPHKDTLRTVTHSPPIIMFGYPVHDFFLFNGSLSKRYSRAKAEPIRLNQNMMREGRL